MRVCKEVEVLLKLSLMVDEFTGVVLSPVKLVLLEVDQEKEEGTLAFNAIFKGTLLQTVTGATALTVTAGTTLTVNVKGDPGQLGVLVEGVMVYVTF